MSPFGPPEPPSNFIHRFLGAFFADRKTTKKTVFSRTLQNQRSRPNVAFIQGLILFVCTHLCRLGPQNEDFRVPFKIIFFQKRTLGGTRVGQKTFKKLVLRVARALWGAPWSRHGFAFGLGFNRINKNEIVWGPLWAPAGRPKIILKL